MIQICSNQDPIRNILYGIAFGKLATRTAICVLFVATCLSLPTSKKVSLTRAVYKLNFSHLGLKDVLKLPNLSRWNVGESQQPKRQLLLRGNQLQVLSYPLGLKGPLNLLDAASNQISTFAPFVRDGSISINRLILRNNRITTVPPYFCQNVTNLELLDLSDNHISKLTKESFSNCTSLRVLLLSQNKITTIAPDTFEGLRYLKELYINSNMVSSLPDGIFKGLEIKLIFLQNNNISSIDELLRWVKTPPDSVYAFENPISLVNLSTDSGFIRSTKLYLGCTHLQRFTSMKMAPDLNCAPSPTLEITAEDEAVIYGLPGFQCMQIGNLYKCQPCPPGTYGAAASKCEPCHPAFYQDQYGQSSCKLCPSGAAVFKKGGQSLSDCATCPAGTRVSIQDGKQSCTCLPGYARSCHLCNCTKCDKYSMECTNGYQDLPREYWWERNDKYSKYVESLQHHSPISENLTFKIPKPYRCPNMDACAGGLNASCTPSYKGPLCNICDKGSYRHFHECLKCPSFSMALLQICWVLIIFVLFCVTVNWADKKYTSSKRSRSLADVMLSSLKTILGFCQILSVILSLLSHIRWPRFMIDISRALRYIDMRILPLQSLKCIFPSLDITLGSEMVLSLAATVILPILVLLILRVRLMLFDYPPTKMNDMKKTCYRSIALFLFATYLFTTRRVFQMMPAACILICSDMEEQKCLRYVKADFRIQCSLDDPVYKLYVYLAYAGLTVLIGFLSFMLVLIKKYKEKRHLVPRYASYEYLINPELIERDDPIEFAIRFFYENYRKSCWYWEFVEMLRKVSFTFGAEFFGSATRTNLAIYITLSGLFIVIYAYMRPIKDTTEHRLQMFSFTVIFLNLCAGVLLKVPSASPMSRDAARDYRGLVAVLVVLNILVICSIVLRMIVAILRSIKIILNERETFFGSFSRCLRQTYLILSGYRSMKV